MKNIGPSFAAELAAANLLGLAFSWGEDGTLSFSPDLAPEYITAIEAVYAAHDPDNTFAVDKAAGLAEFRADRRAMFALIGEMGFVALATNNATSAAALVAFRQGVKDLPEWPTVVAATNLQALKVAMAVRYKTLTDALPPGLRAEFKKLAE